MILSAPVRSDRTKPDTSHRSPVLDFILHEGGPASRAIRHFVIPTRLAGLRNNLTVEQIV